LSPLVPSASPRRCRPGFLQLDWPGCWWRAPAVAFPPVFFHVSRHLFSKNSQQLSILK
ncbi:hypothetical protein FQA23_0010821, partial [Aptenodytes patagonicus]